MTPRDWKKLGEAAKWTCAACVLALGIYGFWSYANAH